MKDNYDFSNAKKNPYINENTKFLKDTYTQLKPYIEEFFSDVHGNNPKESRYLSWEHCYIEFQKKRREVIDNRKLNKTLSDDDIDFLALHLGFYLASWGMMRGSSFLLNMDYKIHNKIVRPLIEDPFYDYLWGLDDNIRNGVAIDADKVYNLYKTLSDTMADKDYYDVNNKVFSSISDDDSNLGSLTPTLFSKILMGTIGCTPAYDRFLVASFKHFNLITTIKAKGIDQLIEFYKANKFEIDQLISKYEGKSGIRYPVMKIIDMAFWDYGFKCSLVEQYFNLLLKNNNTIKGNKPLIDNLYIGDPDSHYDFRLKMEIGNLKELNANIKESLTEIANLKCVPGLIKERSCLNCNGDFTNTELHSAKDFKNAIKKLSKKKSNDSDKE